ncbi:MAG TPA: alkaline phosphatase family protein [Anaerolineales bacterium]|nr:alkaline phosphatase family protein [Anaerolineales bacterium]
MKKNILILFAALLLVAAAVGAYFWANAIMDSLFDYRSPLAENPPSPGKPVGEPLTGRVVIILVDGLREDTAMKTHVMPYLDTLRQQGAWATMRSRTPSYSAPGWATILTGAWPTLNDGQSANPPDFDSVRAITQDNIFSAADRAGFQTAVSGFDWFDGMLAASGLDAGFYTQSEDNAADTNVMEAAKSYLQDSSYQLVLVHFDQVDYAGHQEGGPQGPNWDPAAARADSMIEELVSQLDLGQDTVLIFSDHGHIDAGGHGGQDAVTLAEPFVMVGKAVVPGRYPDIQMVDIAPTVTTLLGTNLPASNQGQVLTKMLNLSPTQTEAVHQALLAQQAAMVSQTLTAVSLEAPAQAPQSAADYQSVLETAFAQRIKQERIPRGIAAGLVFLLLAGIIVYKRNRATPWLFGGALLYMIIFNIIYAWIVGKTYSLSSVYSADDLILSTALYTAISLLVTWLAVMLGQRAFSQGAASAAQMTLKLSLTILFLLMIPIMWNYYNNGLVISWTLPDFLPMFLGFLSLIQALIASVLSLLLAGIAALTAKIIGGKQPKTI